MSLDLKLYELYGAGNFSVKRNGDPILNEIGDRLAADRRARQTLDAFEHESEQLSELPETSATVLDPVSEGMNTDLDNIYEAGVPLAIESTIEQNDIPVISEIKHGRRLSISFDRISLLGVQKAVNKIKNLPMNLHIAILTSREVEEELTYNEQAVLDEVRFETKTNRKKKLVIAAGGLAVVGAAYLASRGIHLSSGGQTHEAVQQITPSRTHLSITEAVQHHPKNTGQVHEATRALGLASTKAASAKSKVDEITVKPGEGITQTIRDYFPGKSANQYADAYNKLSAKYGAGHIIEGIRKYKMSNGSLGLSHAGPAHWGAHVHSFLQTYFKQNK